MQKINDSRGCHQLFIHMPYTSLSSDEGHARPDSSRNMILGGDMACRGCESQNQQVFPVELVFAFPGIEGTKLSPVHVSHKILICLDCGYAQLVLPPARLEQLKKGICKVRSMVA